MSGVKVYKQTSAARFAAAVSYAVANSSDVAVGDVNADSLPTTS